MKGSFKTVILGLLLLLLTIPAWAAGLDLESLSDKDIASVKALIAKLEPFIVERDRAQTLTRLTFKELYAPLRPSEKVFLKKFEMLDPKVLHVKIPYRGIATGEEALVAVKDQKIRNKGKDTFHTLSVQFVPAQVLKDFKAMNKAMEKDIGKRLYIESGYRSSAYQLYLFVFYLKNHNYSIRETVKFVALPGFSEHGWPAHQALDFINGEGINGEDDVREFEVLPEYEWLLKNAGRFGFVLSYPKGAKAGITFEPWHWRHGG